MKRSLRLHLALAFLLCLTAGDSVAQASADSLQRKVDYLIANGQKRTPDPRPTVLTDQEVDAYMNSGRLKVPPGISDIHLTTTVGEAVGNAKVDFDKLTADVRKTNPLWELFSGVHDVKVRCGVWGKDGMGNVHVQNVWLDDHEIPRVALEFFLEHYIKPKVPQASLDSRFKMPARIQTAIITRGKTTLYQK
ncbi:MAG TPA: hypothetical protein VL382_04125 [Terriglobales bacterium]|nr:hypothetical protein [Terriglobales bacterium]